MSANFFDRTVVMKLTLNRPGSSRKVKTSQIEVDADKSMLAVTKKLMKWSPEFKALNSRMNELGETIRSLSVPSPLGKGHYAIPIERVRVADEAVQSTRAAIFEPGGLLDVMMEAYPERVRESQEKLKDLGNPADYPTPERFRAAWGISSSYESFGTPAKLEEIDPAIYQREVGQAKLRIEQAADKIIDVLSLEFKGVLDAMVERLTPDSDGKPKTFRNTLVSNMTDFLSNIKVRNIVDREELNKLSEDATRILEGVTPEQLRQSRDVRTYVRESMAKVTAELETAVINRPRRVFTPSEDEEAA